MQNKSTSSLFALGDAGNPVVSKDATDSVPRERWRLFVVADRKTFIADNRFAHWAFQIFVPAQKQMSV